MEQRQGGAWSARSRCRRACASAQPLIITTVAGYAGKGSADGVGSGALFMNPQGVAIDAAGNVYVADTGNNTIRMITSAGVSSTLAGSAGASGSADGAGSIASFQSTGGHRVGRGDEYLRLRLRQQHHPAGDSGRSRSRPSRARRASPAARNNTGTNATFFNPMGIAVDSSTNLYVADYGNHIIRKITPSVCSEHAGRERQVRSASPMPAARPPAFYEPEALAVDNSGNVYVADTGNAAIRKVTSSGSVIDVRGFARFAGQSRWYRRRRIVLPTGGHRHRHVGKSLRF